MMRFPDDYHVEELRGRQIPTNGRMARALRHRLEWLRKKLVQRRLHPNYDPGLDYTIEEIGVSAHLLDLLTTAKGE
jgi:hypothetical protein